VDDHDEERMQPAAHPGPADGVRSIDGTGPIVDDRGGDDGMDGRSHDVAVRAHHGLRTLTALCLATAFLAAFASIGAAAEAPLATGRIAIPKSTERMVALKSKPCPAPLHAPSCRTATPKSAERMLRHPVRLKSEACPAPFDATTTCGVATVPADWAEPDGRTLEIWYASVPRRAAPRRG
jgi:hypothetical protein